jgi:hypothetical protein
MHILPGSQFCGFHRKLTLASIFGSFGPDTGESDQGGHRVSQVVQASPLGPAVEIVLAAE